jgi:DUF438 domain-containing protein
MVYTGNICVNGKENVENSELYLAILNSLKAPVVFVDSEHHIRFVNDSGAKQYSKYGIILGKSIFDCHNPESIQKIKDIYIQLLSGADEVIYLVKEDTRIYMHAVRDSSGHLIGYYEKYEAKSNSL